MQEPQETWVRSLGWEDPLEESTTTHSSILFWRIPMDRGAWQATVHGVRKSQTRLRTEDMHKRQPLPSRWFWTSKELTQATCLFRTASPTLILLESL